MPGILMRWIVTTLAIVLVPHVVSGVRVEGLGTALAAGAILGILNALVRPALIILTLPLTVVSIGLFVFVINGLLFEFAAALVPGMHVDSFWSALAGSIIVSIVSWVLNSVAASRDGGITVEGYTVTQPEDQDERPRGPSRKRGKKTVELRQGKDGMWE